MPASAAPTLDGLVVGRPVDPADPAAGWLARDLAAGRWVLLRSLPEGAPVGASPADGWPLHPHLLAPRVLSDVHGASWVVVAFVAGERLDRLGPHGGGLSPGQLLSLALPLAGAVAAVHQAGQRVPGLAAADVLLAASGRPLLDGWVLLRDPGESRPDDDVRALAGLLLARLAVDDGPLRELLASAAARPPSAAELQRELARLGPAEPLPAGPARGGSRVPAPAGRRRRSRPRRFARPLVLLLAVAGLAAVAGTAWARLAAPDAAAVLTAVPAQTATVEPAAEPSVPPAAVDWVAVLESLDAARGVAFARGDAEPLAAADAPGSSAEARDLEAVAALRRSAATARGWAPRVHAVEVLSAGPRAALLRVADELPPWELVDGTGRVVHRFPARPRGTWQVALAWAEEAGWRVVDARPDAAVS